jgi:hypothetical protein
MILKQAHLKFGREVSIQLVSPASGEILYTTLSIFFTVSFHSISFPSEWGVCCLPSCHHHPCSDEVSIQLVSPASGELIDGLIVNT